MNILNMSFTFPEAVLLLRILEGIAETNTLKEFEEANVSLSDFASLLEKVQTLDDCFTGKDIPF